MLDTPLPQPADLRSSILNVLRHIRKPPKSLPEYYLRLLNDEDVYLLVGGMAALLDLGQLTPEHWERAVTLSHHGAIGRRAFRFFQGAREYALAERVLKAFANADIPEDIERMRAELAMDPQAVGEYEIRAFLATGDIPHLTAAARSFEAASGWRNGVLWAARATALHPIVPQTAWQLLSLLEASNQFDLIAEILDIFRFGDVFPMVRRTYRGTILVERGKAHDAIALLMPVDLKTIPIPPLRAAICAALARAHEKLGDYRTAADYYKKQNQQFEGEKPDPAGFMRSVRRLAMFEPGPLADDPHDNHFMMVGFPRSGTTLLENMLNAHPDIETFEEIPSYQSLAEAMQIVAETKFPTEQERLAAVEKGRNRYYIEIERRLSKSGAKVFVDKLPIRSAYAKSLEKFFPRKKYIFSIRHPYDVILSCYKQNFTPNPAMENFRVLDTAFALYDEVMSIWFSVFPAESERICYLRYDDLVTNFESEMRRVLAFLGVGWSDDVHQFAEKSEARKVATPSYAKVRAGLSIGVQSSWQNYKFLFDTKEAAVLNKWVDRFGYQR